MILVTGGTGLVGSHLLYFLLQENEIVRAIHREGSDLLAVKKIFQHYTENFEIVYQKIEWVQADIIDIPALTDAFKNITHVYHAAAFVSFDTGEYQKLKKANIEGTANIVNLCLSNKIQKLCYVSSVATLGTSKIDSLITEETEWNTETENSVYAITKYGAEMEVWRGSQEGLAVGIVNPGVILGISPKKSGSDAIVRIGKSGLPFYSSGGMGIVAVRDVALALQLLMKSDIKNERFILVGNNIHYKELFTKLALHFGKKPPKWKLSKNLLLFCSGFMQFFGSIFGLKVKLKKATVHTMFKTSFYDTSKFRNAFQFTFSSLEETLKELPK